MKKIWQYMGKELGENLIEVLDSMKKGAPKIRMNGLDMNEGFQNFFEAMFGIKSGTL